MPVYLSFANKQVPRNDSLIINVVPLVAINCQQRQYTVEPHKS